MVHPARYFRKSSVIPVTVHFTIERDGEEIELAIEADHDPGDAPQVGIGPDGARYDDPGDSPTTSITEIYDHSKSDWCGVPTWMGALTDQEKQTTHEKAGEAAAEYIRNGGY